MGIPWLVVHPSTAFSDDAVYSASRTGNIEYFKRLCAFAQKHGVGIAVENMWDLHIAPRRYYADHAEEWIFLLNEITNPKEWKSTFRDVEITFILLVQ